MRLADAVSVPVIDLAPARAGGADRLRVAAAMDAACREHRLLRHRRPQASRAASSEICERSRTRSFRDAPLSRSSPPGIPWPENRGYHAAGGEGTVERRTTRRRRPI